MQGGHQDQTGTEPSSAHQLRYRNSNCFQLRPFHMVSLIQGPLFAHPCQVCASRDMSMTMGPEKSLLSFTDPSWPPQTLQNRHSTVNLASATRGQGVTKKGNDNQTGHKEEPCSGVWAEPGNTPDPPPPWEGTAVLDSRHPTALSDGESLRWILQRDTP